MTKIARTDTDSNYFYSNKLLKVFFFQSSSATTGSEYQFYEEKQESEDSALIGYDFVLIEIEFLYNT